MTNVYSAVIMAEPLRGRVHSVQAMNTSQHFVVCTLIIVLVNGTLCLLLSSTVTLSLCIYDLSLG